MNTSDIIILATIIVYMAAMVVIGIVLSRRNSNVGDFYLGGRKLGPLVTAMSAEASDMSSYLLMGHKCGAITIPDFFSNRYKDDKKVLLGISALIILIFFVPYTASGFSACGKLFNSLFGWNYHTAMLISAVIIIAYTCTGGFLAASTTDLIQSIVMTLALVSILIFGVSNAGGLGNVIDNAKSIPGYFSLASIHNVETGGADKYSILTIASLLAWGLGYFGMPHILLRFMAVEDKQKLKTSRRIASIWVVISMAIAIFIGFIGNALTKKGEFAALSGADSERVIIKIAQYMSDHHTALAVIAGLVFAGILACTMSTSDSQLLAASSAASENILKSVLKIKMDEKKSMFTARIALVIIAVLGVIIAWDQNSSIFRVVSFAWAGFGATFGPVILTALFWKRSNKYGATAGMIAGGVMVFLWKFGIAKLGGVFAIYELLPAFVVALIAIIVVSLCTAPPSKEITEEFDSVQADLHK